MRKLIVSMWITLDGFVAGEDDSMDWILGDGQMSTYEQALVDTTDTLLLGRITYTDFASYWPIVAKDDNGDPVQQAYAKRLDELKKVVVSEPELDIDWDSTERLSNIDKGEILTLKKQPGKNIVMYGSLSVVNALAELDLIDEYHLLVHPLYLRKGRALFKEDGPAVTLELISAEPFSSGVVLMKYRRAN